MYRRSANVERLIPGYREAVSDFLERAPLEESSIIIHGPGIGCSSYGILLALIGLKQLTKLKALHFFSSSGYAGFFIDASHRQHLRICREDVSGWNKRNQGRHSIRPFLTAMGFVRAKIVGKAWYFRNHLLSDALRSTVSDHYANSAIEFLPPNFHFWTYNETTCRFCDIHSRSIYSRWTPSEVISSLVAVRGLYEPFRKNGCTYSDAISNTSVRNVFREIRKESKNILFWHMKYHGRRGNTLYVKGHHSRSALTRLVGDFALFLLGLNNVEFGRPIELCLFDL